MKKVISYILIIILGIIIGCLINYLISNNNNIKDVYKSLVYIESSDQETIKSGSGFVYKTEGNKNYIVTSYHVVDGYTDIYVYNTNKDKEKANLVNYDENTDIAIITVEDNLNLNNTTLGDSDSVEVGDDIYVLGTPLNIDYISTMSKGIVSFINREITVNTPHGSIKFNTIQVDAKVDEGNSGGPILNNKGKVIGMMFVKEQNVDGISFALPINFVIDIIEDLEKK